MGPYNPVTSSADKYNSSLLVICKLIGAVTVDRGFPTADLIREVKEERQGGKKYWDDMNDAKLCGIVIN